MPLKVPYFKKYCSLSKKELAEGLCFKDSCLQKKYETEFIVMEVTVCKLQFFE